jgi:hypothetical protein
VSRQAVLKIIDGWYEQNRDTENIEDLIVLITYMDSVRPQEPTGHWIKHEHGFWSCVNKNGERDGWIPDYECSECGSRAWEHKTNYCPQCGAWMFEPQESED